MKKPEYISLNDYNYHLPEDRIAPYPLPERDSSNLLVYRPGRIIHKKFRDLPVLLPSGAMLVFNETRVIHARLRFRKKTGAPIEIFCLEPVEPFDYQLNFSSKSLVTWKCMVGNLKKWKGEILEKESDKGFRVFARLLKSYNGNQAHEIEFSWDEPGLSFSEIIEEFGTPPIPPYLNREAENSDSETYQTVYSRNEGSVAAPTAGLHFTPGLMESITQSNIKKAFLNLHVGAGTFVPVKSSNAVEHNMHIERVSVPLKTVESLLAHGGPIIPVGTTSCRSLESLYWIGEKILSGHDDSSSLNLEQWEAYRLRDNLDRKDTLSACLDFMHKYSLENLQFSTGIMITPGYNYKMTDALLTNFHQPSSTLLMLVAAMVGDDWKEIYHYAMEKNFRFLSYGDSSLLFP